jgi:tRNA(fMet)-specific endonuclease VapC
VGGVRQISLRQVTEFLNQFPSLPFDDKAADAAANIRNDLASARTTLGPNDLLIAAIAVSSNLVLVTHNTGEFSRVGGLKWEDWEI